MKRVEIKKMTRQSDEFADMGYSGPPNTVVSMSNGYPSSHEQAGGFHSPDEFDEVQHKNMTPVEIGIIAGTVVGFALVVILILYCRHTEHKRKTQRTVAFLEEGRCGGTGGMNAPNGNTTLETRFRILKWLLVGQGRCV